MNHAGVVARWALLLFAAALPAGRHEPERPNVLFIAIDDLRCDLGCYGSKVIKSPHIDRLAARGMRFDRAYVQATFCNPSRTSFLTGLRPARTKVHSNLTPFRDKLPDVVTLPQLFQRNGYATTSIGKVFHGREKKGDPKEWERVLHPKREGPRPGGEGRNLTGGALKWCSWQAAEGTDEDQPDGMIAREAVRFLEQTAKAPFFFAVGFHKPHDPFVAPQRYFEMYPPESIVLHRDPPDLTPAPPLHFGKAYKEAFDKFTDRERREFQRAYAAGSSFVDAQIGKVLEALEQSRFAKNTIVVLLSDHGYHLGERGWWNKATLFEHTTRSPLIVAAPGMKAKGKGCSRIVEFIDLYPTLAELCGLKPPDDLDGRSFASLLDDPEGEGKPAAFTFSPRSDTTGLTVRTARWRYTEWGGGAKYRELYDHESDPGETRNLADDPKFADVVKQHRKLIRERLDK